MDNLEIDNISISIDINGSNKYSKLSYPVRYGRYFEIQTHDYIYQFNLNGEIKYIQGRSKDWPYGDWLKRTICNDWVYYTAGEYTNIYSYLGEYYAPCFMYESNSIFPYKPFKNNAIKTAIHSVKDLTERMKYLIKKPIPLNFKEIIQRIILNNNLLSRKSKKYHEIIGNKISVLPPDTRHSDYDVIPIMISDGCRYNCSFCSVKSGNNLSLRSKDNILQQINNVKILFDKDISNYNSIFFGNHDGLHADLDLLEFTAIKSYDLLEMKKSFMKDAYLYLFGSIHSFLNSEEKIFKSLNESPFYTYINIGLESADQATLELLQKPVKESDVVEAFNRMIEINKKYDKLEITANFLIGSELPKIHYSMLEHLINDNLDRHLIKGAIYLSPMICDKNTREIKKIFIKLKSSSRIPAFLYLIQRL